MSEYNRELPDEINNNPIAQTELQRIDDPAKAEALARDSDPSRTRALNYKHQAGRTARSDPESARISTIGRDLEEQSAESAESAAALIHDWLTGWRSYVSGGARADLRSLLETKYRDLGAPQEQAVASASNIHENTPRQLAEVEYQIALAKYLEDIDDQLARAFKGEGPWPSLDNKSVATLSARHREDFVTDDWVHEDHMNEVVEALCEWYRERWLESRTKAASH